MDNTPSGSAGDPEFFSATATTNRILILPHLAYNIKKIIMIIKNIKNNRIISSLPIHIIIDMGQMKEKI